MTKKAEMAKFREIKAEIRILGLDDGKFIPRSRSMADIIGVVFRGGHWLEGVLRTEVQVDGLDATEKITDMVVKSPHYDQLRVLMLNGITFGGFNVVNIKELNKVTRLSVIALTKEKPDLANIKAALSKLTNWELRWRAIEDAGPILPVITKAEAEPIHIQIAGIHEDDAKKIVKMSCTHGSIPEPVRVAHIIAQAVSRYKTSL